MTLHSQNPLRTNPFHSQYLIPPVITLLFSLILLIFPAQTWADEGPQTDQEVGRPFSDLNLRFSNRPLAPPTSLVVQTIPLSGITVARPFVAPSPQAVIFENDQRQRVAILSSNNSGALTLFLLEQLPLDPKLSRLLQCSHARGCQTDRTPLTGGLGCLAFCLKELLEAAALNPPSS